MTLRRGVTAVVPFLVLLLLAAALGTGEGASRRAPESAAGSAAGSVPGEVDGADGAGPKLSTVVEAPATDPPAPATRAAPSTRHGDGGIFDDGRLVVAYYGTAGTGALGVLGESPPDEMDRRLRRAARPFVRPGQRMQPVYELIVTIADARPGRDGDYNHHLARRQVARYLEAAERHRALVLLDVQPGRDGFLNVAKHWRWALEHPAVGLALDPEWRMGRRDVPGRTIGSVSAREVNRVSAWVAKIVKQEDLPEKLFVIHQFRDSMVRDIEEIVQRPGLAMVQHVDGFGTRAQKLATYQAVARPDQFTMGLKLFYDEDTARIDPAYLRTVRPPVRFLSFQ